MSQTKLATNFCLKTKLATNFCLKTKVEPQFLQYNMSKLTLIKMQQQIEQVLLKEVQYNMRVRFMIAPECRLYCDDLFYNWAVQVIDENRELIVKYIQTCAKEDLMKLVENVFTDVNWPAHRRSFFSALLNTVIEMEQLGVYAGMGFIRFMKDRYAVYHNFARESEEFEEKEESSALHAVKLACGLEPVKEVEEKVGEVANVDFEAVD